MKFFNNLDLQKNEIQNFRVQNLADAPSNPVAGQHYFNTQDNTEYVWNGTKWVDALSQGDYTFEKGIAELDRVVSLTAATAEDIGGVTIGTNIDVDENGKISVKNAAEGVKGVIAIASAEEATAGTNETKAVNPKQVKDVVDAAKTELEGRIDEIEGQELTAADLKATAPLKYDQETTTFSVDLDEAPTTESEKLVNSGAVYKAIDDAKTEVKGQITTDVTAAKTELKAEIDKKADITALDDYLKTADLKATDPVKFDADTKTISVTLDETIAAKGTGLATTGTIHTAIEAAKTEITTEVNKKLDKNEPIEAGTHTKITYDTKGLVTKGEDLTAEDIPDLTLDKITDVTATAEELNYVSGVTSAIQTQLDDKATKAEVTALDNRFILATEKGNANGVATLGEDGKVPSTQLPSYVDDVIEIVTVGTEPEEAAEGDVYYNTEDNKLHTYTSEAWDEGVDPEAGKIYVTKDTNMSYRWGGTTLVQIGADKLKGYNTTLKGDDATTSFTINHGLGTKNVVFEIYEAAEPFEKIYVNVQHTDNNSLTVVFAQAPATGTDFVITVIAIG